MFNTQFFVNKMNLLYYDYKISLKFLMSSILILTKYKENRCQMYFFINRFVL